MGLQATQLVTQFPITILHDFVDINKRRYRPCSSIGSRMRRDWEKDVNQSGPDQRFRFNDGYDLEDEYGFRDATKQRIWWYDSDDDDVYDDAGEYDGDVGFDTREASIGVDLFFKIFRAFAWMIPAITISLLMGTGHDSIIMVLGLPLAQTALSLLSEALWGRQVDSPRPKSKNKKKRPFARTRNRTRVRKDKEMYAQARNSVGNYKSWLDLDDVSEEKQKIRNQEFGGWDELDNKVSVDRGDKALPTVEREPRTKERVKIVQQANSETPLFIRLIIATFPFLGFWTRLL